MARQQNGFWTLIDNIWIHHIFTVSNFSFNTLFLTLWTWALCGRLLPDIPEKNYARYVRENGSQCWTWTYSSGSAHFTAPSTWACICFLADLSFPVVFTVVFDKRTNTNFDFGTQAVHLLRHIEPSLRKLRRKKCDLDQKRSSTSGKIKLFI